MQPLFGSETDGIQERKLVKRLLRKKKITFILTALCAVIYLLQNIGFEEPMMDLFHYPAYSWEDQEVWRYFTHAIVHLSVPHIFRGSGYLVARLSADLVLSIFYYWS